MILLSILNSFIIIQCKDSSNIENNIINICIVYKIAVLLHEIIQTTIISFQ